MVSLLGVCNPSFDNIMPLIRISKEFLNLAGNPKGLSKEDTQTLGIM